MAILLPSFVLCASHMRRAFLSSYAAAHFFLPIDAHLFSFSLSCAYLRTFFLYPPILAASRPHGLSSISSDYFYIDHIWAILARFISSVRLFQTVWNSVAVYVFWIFRQNHLFGYTSRLMPATTPNVFLFILSLTVGCYPTPS